MYVMCIVLRMYVMCVFAVCMYVMCVLLCKLCMHLCAYDVRACFVFMVYEGYVRMYGMYVCMLCVYVRPVWM